MRSLTIIILILVIQGPLHSQQKEAAGFAVLQLTGLTIDGTEAIARSQELSIKYEEGLARGALSVGTLVSEDKYLSGQLVTVANKNLFFEIPMPEGKFTFGDSLEEIFDAHGKIMIDDYTSEFDLTFTISNMKSSDQNLFLVTGRGRLSLANNFQVYDTLGFQDSFTFFFNQNLRIYKP